MSGEQICLQVPPKLFEVPQMIRSGDRKCTGHKRCYGELVELTVDDIWQIVDAGDQELWKVTHYKTSNTY